MFCASGNNVCAFVWFISLYYKHFEKPG